MCLPVRYNRLPAAALLLFKGRRLHHITACIAGRNAVQAVHQRSRSCKMLAISPSAVKQKVFHNVFIQRRPSRRHGILRVFMQCEENKRRNLLQRVMMILTAQAGQPRQKLYRNLRVGNAHLFHIGIPQRPVPVPNDRKILIHIIPCHIHILLLIIPEQISFMESAAPAPAALAVIGRIHIFILSVQMADFQISVPGLLLCLRICIHHKIHTVIQAAGGKTSVAVHLPSQLLLHCLKQPAFPKSAPPSSHIFVSLKSAQVKRLGWFHVRFHFQQGYPGPVLVSPSHGPPCGRRRIPSRQTFQHPVNLAFPLINPCIKSIRIYGYQGKYCQKGSQYGNPGK